MGLRGHGRRHAPNLGKPGLGRQVLSAPVQRARFGVLQRRSRAHQISPALANEKTAAAFDKAFETVKQASGGLLGTLSAVPQSLRTAYVLAMLGSAAAGGKYMYDRTKAITEGENLAKAQASRARMRGLPPVWVDPDTLANVKSVAQTNG